jgi:hypothetical protein
MTTTAHVTEYAAAVRAALADVPEPDRTELLEDLEDHLEEIAAESTESLTARLGTPESYAAELRAAYTGTTLPKSQPRRDLFGMAKADYRRRFPEGIGWPEVLRFLREFLVIWWIIRAGLVYLFLTDGSPMPTSPIDLVFPLLLVVVSVACGILARNRQPRGGWLLLLIGTNVLILLAGYSAYDFHSWRDFVRDPVSYVQNTDYVGPEVATESHAPLDSVVNIYPYSKEGKPLTGVLLYDQSGNPIQTNWQQGPYELIPQPSSSPPPASNSYPQPLCVHEGTEERMPQCATALPEPPDGATQTEPAESTPVPEPTGSATPKPTVSPTPTG